MRFIGNVIWVALGGVWMALAWAVLGVVLAITIIGFPFALQCFKLARFSFWPFGHEVIHDPTASPLGFFGAILWFIPGLIMALLYVLSGVAMCLTIIGIPFGIQQIKLAGLALQPFGKKIVDTDDLARFGYVA